MPISNLYLGATGDNRLFRVGQVGINTGNTDPDGSLNTAFLTTERQYPAGRDALVNFRRVVLRFKHNAAFIMSSLVYVDEQNTEIFINGTPGTQVHSISTPISLPSPSIQQGDTDMPESTVSLDFAASGSSIQVFVGFVLDHFQGADPEGIVMLESIEAHGRVIRPSRSRAANVGVQA